AFSHWQPLHVCPAPQAPSSSHCSLPHTCASPHTSTTAQTHWLHVVHGSEQTRPGSPHCSPGSLFPSPHSRSWTSYAPRATPAPHGRRLPQRTEVRAHVD